MILIVLVFLSIKLTLPLAIRAYHKVGIIKKNYLGHQVPISLGLFFLPFIILFLIVFNSSLSNNLKTFYICVAIAITLVGFYDDLKGDTTIKGLKGHFSELLRGRLTSGIAKVGVTSIIGLFASLFYIKDSFDKIVSFLIVILLTNTLNLFDLRPGRAIKLFFFIALFILTWGLLNKSQEVFLLYPLLGIVLAYAPIDLKGEAMLGDAGSNLLGMLLGILMILIVPFWVKFVFLIVLIVLHWYTEQNSLTLLIAGNTILNKLDYLGRRMPGGEQND